MKNSINNYTYGTAAKNLDVRTAIYDAPTHETLKGIRSETKRQKKMHMSVLYVLFLAVAVAFLGYTLVSYVKLQSDITACGERISAYETRLNDLRLANDDEYSKMVNAVDLNEVRRIAIEELGMVYADESQVITYTRENSDYVRQLTDIPD